MNNQQIMTYEEFKEFFSSTHEFTTSVYKGETYRLTYKEDGKATSLLIYQPTIQTIIRVITQLMWNFHHNILD